MNQKSAFWITKCVNAATAAATVVVGICLVSACLGIYKGGEGEFTRSAVASAFGKISVFVYIWLALVLAGAVCSFVMPREKVTPKKQDLRYQLRRLRNRAELDCDDLDVMSERKKRCICNTIMAVVTSTAVVVYLFYVLNSGNYTGDISASVAKAAVAFCVCFAIPACLYLAFVVFSDHSIRREIELLKKLPKKAKATARFENTSVVPVVRAVLIVVGVSLFVVGICMGGMADVLAKAINICTECVGLG